VPRFDTPQASRADRICTDLLVLAREFAQSRRTSPFASKARAEGLIFEGGKMDDITIAVIEVLTEEEKEKTVKAKL